MLQWLSKRKNVCSQSKCAAIAVEEMPELARACWGCHHGTGKVNSRLQLPEREKQARKEMKKKNEEERSVRFSLAARPGGKLSN